MKKPLTFGAERPVEGSGRAVAQIAVIPLHTLPPIPAVHPKAGAVALATRLHPRRHFGPLLQVEGDAIHPQGSDTTQEPPLSPCST